MDDMRPSDGCRREQCTVSSNYVRLFGGTTFDRLRRSDNQSHLLAVISMLAVSNADVHSVGNGRLGELCKLQRVLRSVGCVVASIVASVDAILWLTTTKPLGRQYRRCRRGFPDRTEQLPIRVVPDFHQRRDARSCRLSAVAS
jgi:hypothetical protein